MSADFVTIAVLGRPRGNRGELTASSLSSHSERFAELGSIFLNGGESGFEDKPLPVERIWDHGGTLIFKFAGVDSITDAEKLRGAEVRIPKSQRVELETDEYFHSDLVGCEVRDRLSDRLIGVVTGWQEFGGPPLLEVNDGSLLIPFVKAICTEILPESRVIRVDLPEGLETINAPA